MRPGAHVLLGAEWWEAKMQYLYIALFVLHWLGPRGAGRACWRSRDQQCGESSSFADRGKLRQGKGGDCLRLEEKLGGSLHSGRSQRL